MGPGIRLSATLVCALAAAIVALAVASAGAATPRITLALPTRIEAGAGVTASGRALDPPAGARAAVEVARGGKWRSLARPTLREGRFRASLRLPQAAAVVRLRAALFVGGRLVAASPVRTLRVLAAPGHPGRGSGGGKTKPSAPVASAPSPAPPIGAVPGTGEPESPLAAPYTGPMYWGAWIGDQLTGEAPPWDMSAVTKFESIAKKPLSLLEFSAPFENCGSGSCHDEGFPTTPFNAIRAHGSIPVLSWGSQSIPASPNEPEFQLSDIVEGHHDEYIEGFAAAAASWGHPFFLRFDWEMNGDWFPWGAGANGNSAAEFVAAWRHVHEIFAAKGATNATWVWCPFVNPNNSANITDAASLYPGDADVDWTCLDGYNWGEHAEPPRKWRTFASWFGPTYDQVASAIAPGKPMMVGETASSEFGGSKATWIEEMFQALPTRFPRIRGLIWFDQYDRTLDWPLESSKAAESAFSSGISASRWLGNSLGGLSASPIQSP